MAEQPPFDSVQQPIMQSSDGQAMQAPILPPVGDQGMAAPQVPPQVPPQLPPEQQVQQPVEGETPQMAGENDILASKQSLSESLNTLKEFETAPVSEQQPAEAVVPEEITPDTKLTVEEDPNAFSHPESPESQQPGTAAPTERA